MRVRAGVSHLKHRVVLRVARQKPPGPSSELGGVPREQKQGTPTQSRKSPSILVYDENLVHPNGAGGLTPTHLLDIPLSSDEG